MPILQRVSKPKTRRGKRFLENRESKLIENEKIAIFVRGATASEKSLSVMKDFCTLKKSNAVFFNKKNDIRPFENEEPLEFFAKKNDATHFMFASHNKKRPHNLIAGRMFDFHILDMFELGLENFVALKEFKGPKVAVGTKPMLLFAGEPFEQDETHQRLKNFFIDFFRGAQPDAIRLQGLEHVITFTAANNRIFFRSYRVLMKKSGSKIPRMELEEIGPRADFVLRRSKMASDDLFKHARKQPVQLKPKKTKNIKRNPLGSTMGRIHMARQDYGKLQTRKLKGLKKTREEKRAHLKGKGQKRDFQQQDNANHEPLQKRIKT